MTSPEIRFALRDLYHEVVGAIPTNAAPRYLAMQIITALCPGRGETYAGNGRPVYALDVEVNRDGKSLPLRSHDDDLVIAVAFELASRRRKAA